jgi:membrane-bound lytic murein transglycosylase F
LIAKCYIFASILYLIVFVFSCEQEIRENSGIAKADTLSEKTEQTIERKKKLLAFKKQIESARYSKSILKYSPVIKKYAKRYGFDWRLIVAQIMQESKFHEQARSPVGARGLMQLMPSTEREISRELDFQYILKNPRENIAAGIYHMKKQYRLFAHSTFNNRIKLSLAAYNCGAGRIFDAGDIARFYKHPSDQWKSIKMYLSMLRNHDWKIHLQVWPQGKPKHGYFYGSEETITYVENIWDMYEIYREIL